MKNINVETIMLSLFFMSLLYLLYGLYTYPTHPSQTGVCCAITVEETSTHSATVHYWSSISDESFDMYVEVEYPDEELTTREQLDAEIVYAVDQMQELCYKNHHQNWVLADKLDLIEERAMNTDLKDCYTWQEIEVIVFGEVQE